MHRPFLFVICVPLLCGAATGPKQDTSHLAEVLRSARGSSWISATQYRTLQSEYATWIDARVKLRESPSNMTRELMEVGLIAHWSDSVEDMVESHAGYLSAVAKRAVTGSKDILAIEAAMFKGKGCSSDTTLLVYDAKTLARVAEVNADPADSEHAFHLSGLDVGARDASGGRLIASGWTLSNCTSSWNPKRIRIDRAAATSLDNLAARNLSARDRFPGQSVSARIKDGVVAFRFDESTSTSELWKPAMVLYHMVDGRAVPDPAQDGQTPGLSPRRH